MSRVLVVTSINSEEHLGLQNLIRNAFENDYKLILVGDEKSKFRIVEEYQKRVDFIPLEKQLSSHLEIAGTLPKNHYARKNYGYLLAASEGYEWIAETDDDNLLYNFFWDSQDVNCSVRNSENCKWLNIYKLFERGDIWHRGIPIHQVLRSNSIMMDNISNKFEIACVQGLANGDPDIDAICRILYKPNVHFDSSRSYILSGNTYSPTNSQMTRWATELALPVMYLPSTVPWRVCDIWRGIIAQRYFYLNNLSTQFRGGLGFQERNEHNLLRDFIEEFEVHSSTDSLIEIIEKINFTEPFQFMRAVYDELISNMLVEPEEKVILESWIADCQKILKKVPNQL